MSCNIKFYCGDFKFRKLMCDTLKPEPSLSITTFVPSYSKWMDKFARSSVILCDATEFISHIFFYYNGCGFVIDSGPMILKLGVGFGSVAQLVTNLAFGLIFYIGYVGPALSCYDPLVEAYLAYKSTYLLHWNTSHTLSGARCN